MCSFTQRPSAHERMRERDREIEHAPSLPALGSDSPSFLQHSSCYSQANALAKDLEQRRSDVPKAILARLQAELEAVRPRSEVECSAKDAENECAGGGGIGKRPRPAAEEVEELRGKLAATGGRMPEIRARIEEAVARTDRVVRAMEYQAQASEGGSGGLGAVLRGGSEGVEGRDQEDDQDGEVSPEVRAAEAAGHISVRKKWAKLMTFSTPIKFSLKDAR